MMNKGLFFAFLMFSLMLACKEDALVREQVIYTKDNLGIEEMQEVEILYSDSARLQVRITAPTMLRYTINQNQQEFPNGLLVEFFDDDQIKTGELSANYGMRYETESKVVVQDSVVWKSTNGEQLDSEELIWDERTRRIYTNKFVTITRPDEIIFGYGFDADQNFTKTRIKAVDGIIKINKFEE